MKFLSMWEQRNSILLLSKTKALQNNLRFKSLYIGPSLGQIIMYQKNFCENKNDRNENFKATIKVGAYIFLHWCLKKKNCKQFHDIKVKSWKQKSTLRLLLKPGPWKTWILRNVINMNLKKCVFREFNKENAQCYV